MKIRRWAAVAAILMIAPACSDTPTQEGGGDGEGAPDRAVSKLEQIYADLEGLDPDQRREELIAMAEEEGAVLNYYGSTNLDDITPIIEEFEDATGVTVNIYRASAEDVLLRILQETDANFDNGVDAVEMNGPQMVLLDREGELAPFDSPTTDQHPEAGVLDNWAWVYINTFVASWNTDRVSASEAPKSWDDVLTKFDGRLAMEAGDFDWFATLVKDYFVKEQGMSEDEAVQLFRDAAAGAASVVDGHTLMAELLVAGEYDIASSTYLHRIFQFKREDAPIEAEPFVEPLVVRPNGVGIHTNAPHPATALLWTEFELSDAQPGLLEIDRQPASASVEGGGLPQGFDFIEVDVEAVVDEIDKWEGLYDEIIQGAGGEVVED
ncbi:MAG: ABC transporter substrate-binding protein [Actinomycetota bacterium]